MPCNAQSFIVDKVDMPGKAGAICFVKRDGKIVGFVHACPCGCGQWGGVHFREYGSGAMWDRMGDDLHMTLTPSIGFNPKTEGGYHWHGFLRNGVFEEC